MRVVLDTPLMDFFGAPLIDGSKELILRTVLLNCASRGTGKETTYEEKAKLFQLGVRIAQADSTIDLESGDIQLLKGACASGFTPLVVGQVGQLLEGRKTLNEEQQ